MTVYKLLILTVRFSLTENTVLKKLLSNCCSVPNFAHDLRVLSYKLIISYAVYNFEKII